VSGIQEFWKAIAQRGGKDPDVLLEDCGEDSIAELCRVF